MSTPYSAEYTPPINVFVHLARGFDAQQWNERFRRGEIVGLNEPWPYGYHHAEDMGCRVFYSADHKEGLVAKGIRLAARAILGFDIIHAWRNRASMSRADVIWTHTESQSGAVGFLRWTGILAKRPRLILQNVWLIDRWNKLDPLKRWLFKRCLSQADRLTFHSDENCRVAQDIFPDVGCEVVRFGISSNVVRKPSRPRLGGPIRVLALGNDVHRDWKTLLQGLGDKDEFEVRIASRRAPKRLIRGTSNTTRLIPKTTSELLSAYEWADLVAVPLKPNQHASGITVIQEALVLGKPVLTSDTGNLRGYFPDSEVFYVPVQEPSALAEQAQKMGAADAQKALSATQRGQDRILEGGLNARGYVQRHVDISRELLGRVTSNQGVETSHKPPLADVGAVSRPVPASVAA